MNCVLLMQFGYLKSGSFFVKLRSPPTILMSPPTILMSLHKPFWAVPRSLTFDSPNAFLAYNSKMFRPIRVTPIGQDDRPRRSAKTIGQDNRPRARAKRAT